MITEQLDQYVETDEAAEAALAADNDARCGSSPCRFLDGSRLSTRRFAVQASDGRILGEGRTKAQAWNDFARLQNLIRK